MSIACWKCLKSIKKNATMVNGNYFCDDCKESAKNGDNAKKDNS